MKENSINLTRIRQHYAILSKAKRKIADYVLENHKEIIDLTAADLAKKTKTSPSTVVWFCRAIGFKGFSDFKLHLENELFAPSTSWLNVETDESIATIKQKTYGFNKISSEQTINLLNNDSLQEAVNLIDQAPQIVIVAEGGSASSARCAYDAFMQIGLQCIFLDDPFFQVLGLSSAPKDAIVLGVCHSGQARNSVEAMMVAKNRGMKTIGLVGIVGSSMMKYIDVALLTGVSEHAFFSDSIAARICELNVISAIHAAIALKRSKELISRREIVNDLFRIKRLNK